MDLLDGLRAFVATAQSGSFTAGAERLGMSNRLSSKYVAELEARLGVRLFARTTRRLGLTQAGEEILARAPALLEEFEALLASVSEGAAGFSGVLRISAPVTFGEIHVKDMLARFAAPHPRLTIDLRLTDAFTDLASEGIDLAFRIGAPGAMALKARRLGEIEGILVASPGYLARAGTPKTIAELARHSCIVDTNRRTPQRWTFANGATVTVSGRFMVNSALVARDLAEAGEGIAFCPHFVLGSAVAEGRLVQVLPEARGASPLNVVWLEGRVLPRKLRALIDFARDDWRQNPCAPRLPGENDSVGGHHR